MVHVSHVPPGEHATPAQVHWFSVAITCSAASPKQHHTTPHPNFSATKPQFPKPINDKIEKNSYKQRIKKMTAHYSLSLWTPPGSECLWKPWNVWRQGYDMRERDIKVHNGQITHQLAQMRRKFPSPIATQSLQSSHKQVSESLYMWQPLARTHVSPTSFHAHKPSWVSLVFCCFFMFCKKKNDKKKTLMFY